VVSLLKGAINDRGCAIGAYAAVVGSGNDPKSSVGDAVPRHASCGGPSRLHARLVWSHLYHTPTTFITQGRKAIGTPYLTNSSHAHQG
jgi:hypothetical protein